jgi:hypothetical protein
MAVVDPKAPLRADHRLIHKLMSLVLKGKFDPHASEYDRISRVFLQAGGSWERVFLGAPRDVDLLKKVVKVAGKQGWLTKKETWS